MAIRPARKCWHGRPKARNAPPPENNFPAGPESPPEMGNRKRGRAFPVFQIRQQTLKPPVTTGKKPVTPIRWHGTPSWRRPPAPPWPRCPPSFLSPWETRTRPQWLPPLRPRLPWVEALKGSGVYHPPPRSRGPPKAVYDKGCRAVVFEKTLPCPLIAETSVAKPFQPGSQIPRESGESGPNRPFSASGPPAPPPLECVPLPPPTVLWGLV